MSSWNFWRRRAHHDIGGGLSRIKRCVASDDGRLFIELWEETKFDEGKYLSIWLHPADHETIKRAQENIGEEFSSEPYSDLFNIK